MKLPKHQQFYFFPPRVVQVNVFAANQLKKTFAVQTAIEEYLSSGVIAIEDEQQLKEALAAESYARSFARQGA